MRVLLTADWFLKYAAEQAVGLRNAGADVRLVCREHLQPRDEFDGSRAEFDAVLERVRSADVDVDVIAGSAGSTLAARDTAGIRRSVNRWKPDIVHAHPTIDPWMPAITFGPPLVLTVHDVRPHPGQPRRGRLRQALSDVWRRRADGFVVHGAALAEELRPAAGSRPILVIPHGVLPAAEPYALPPSPTVLFFGRLEPYKGILVLVNAMEKVWARQPDVELVVAGRGPVADQLPAHPRLRRLIRYIPESEVDGLLASASLVAAPYTEASQSGVVALAVARGIPVIVSDQGSLSEATVDESFVVPAGDSGALAQAISAHLGHDVALRASVHAMAVERLSWDAAGRLSLEFYRCFLGS